jgi:hypothetical protein
LFAERAVVRNKKTLITWKQKLDMNKRQNLIPRLLLILILLPFGEAFGQEFSESSIKIGLGAGVSSGYYMDGLGLVYTIGYQKEIWKYRFRFNPNFSVGNYSSKRFSDGRDQYFNSINLEANFFNLNRYLFLCL